MSAISLTTVCYIEKDDKVLMMHRVKKESDLNAGKWIGIGGHFEPGESPEECVLREVKEETGLTLTSYRYRALITFVYGSDASDTGSPDSCITEYMHLFTADGFEGSVTECDEGVLEWIERERFSELEMWAGDRIFHNLLKEREDFFSLKLEYDASDRLVRASLDGKEIHIQ